MPPAIIRRWHIFMMSENTPNCSFENNLDCTMTHMPSKERIPHIPPKDNYSLSDSRITKQRFGVFTFGAAFTGRSRFSVSHRFGVQANSPFSIIQIHINKFFIFFPHPCPINTKITPLLIVNQYKCHIKYTLSFLKSYNRSFLFSTICLYKHTRPDHSGRVWLLLF